MDWQICFLFLSEGIWLQGFCACAKGDNMAVSCIFIGYRNEKFGYSFWDPKKKRIVGSRDVVFYEYQIVEDFKRGQQPEKAVIELSPLNNK